MRSPNSSCRAAGPAWPLGEGRAPATHRAETGAAKAPDGSPEKSSRGRRERARRPPSSSSPQPRRGPGPRCSGVHWVLPDPPPGSSPLDGAGTLGRHTRQVQLPRLPDPQRLSCDEGRPGLAAAPHSATATTSRCPRTRRPSAPPGSHSPQLLASYSGCSGHRQAPRRPLARLGLPGNRGSSATPGGPPAERAQRAAGAAPATCARCRLLPRTPPRAPGTRRRLPSSPTVGPLSCSKPLLGLVVSVLIPGGPLEGLFHRLRLNQQDSFL